MNEIIVTKNRRFRKNETFKHKCAVEVLATWVNGIIEKPFLLDGLIVFVPDIAVYKNGILTAIYEVVNSHPLSSKKYGLIQYFCYRSVQELTVYEVSAEYILSLKEKPEYIQSMECYTVNPFEYEDIQDYLLNPVK